MTTPLAEHPGVRSAIDLLGTWIETQLVYRELPGLSMGIVHDQAVICPADKLAIVVFINADDGEPWMFLDKAFDWVGSAIASATKPAAPVADPAWQRYVGRYRNTWGDLQVVVHGGELRLIGPAAPDPLLAPSTLRPVGEHTFRVETKDGYGVPGELAVFELDAAGRVTRVRIGENYTQRVETWEDP